MSSQDRPPAGLTVGSLLGLPLGAAPDVAAAATAAALPEESRPAAPPSPVLPAPPPGVQESRGWIIVNGQIGTEAGGLAEFRPDGVATLSYSNPFAQNIERVWFDGKLVFALDVGEIDVDETRVKVAQEYQIVYAVDLDEHGKKTREPEAVEGQYNIYDSVPGMEQYSPIWRFNYVVVPRGYVPNTLRSAADCEQSGFTIVRSRAFEN